jgi:hypothetical protein
MRAYWGERERSISSEGELSATVAELRRGEPTMLFLEVPGGPTLVVGVGNAESVLTFVEPDGTSFHSRGDISRRGRLRFWCRGQLDEFMEEMAVPESLALAAAEEFVKTKERPSSIRWEADW